MDLERSIGGQLSTMKNSKNKKHKRNKLSAKNTVLILVLVCIACLVGVILLTSNGGISSDEAYEIVLKDLGMTAKDLDSPHIHEGTYQNQPCYNIYVTVNGESLTYVVSTEGEILHKGEGSHSH